ncbi:hypothetical protein [Amycolatopsis acididurans]|uniref:hypothetical protein n=1 Tax=Amycolatopsis acididurans TaxID=2724524 RepID=UPI001FEC8CC2|nr:hypothetical protein [Amycolatopsis acididurans]
MRTKLENLDGLNFADILPVTLDPTTRSGGWPGTIIGGRRTDVTGCDSATSAPDDFSTVGAVFEDCRLYIGSPTDPITSLAYTDEPYGDAGSKAVTWRR